MKNINDYIEDVSVYLSDIIYDKIVNELKFYIYDNCMYDIETDTHWFKSNLYRNL